MFKNLQREVVTCRFVILWKTYEMQQTVAILKNDHVRDVGQKQQMTVKRKARHEKRKARPYSVRYRLESVKPGLENA